MPIIASIGAASSRGFGQRGGGGYKVRYLVVASGGGGNYGPGQSRSGGAQFA